MLQKFANVDLDNMSFDYTAEENESTVWPSKSSEKLMMLFKIYSTQMVYHLMDRLSLL